MQGIWEELVLLGEPGPVYPPDAGLELLLAPLYVRCLFLHGTIRSFQPKRRNGANGRR